MIQFVINTGGHSSPEADNVLICLVSSLVSLCTEKGVFTEKEFSSKYTEVLAAADQKLAAERDVGEEKLS